MFFLRIKTILFFFLISIALSGFSQSSQEPFGKNRIQYSNFKWKYISTYNFEIYYYGETKDLALTAGYYAEEDFERIKGITGFTPAKKIKIILYNSASDMLQSNLGLVNEELMTGGQTVLVKSRVEIAFKGTKLQLMKDLSYGIAYIMIDNIMYGGNVKDVIRSSYLISLPEWFVSGAASYVSEDWSIEMDDHMRDLAANGKLKNPAAYQGDEAKLIGQSVWNFIGKQYSETDVSNIINLTRAYRNEEQSIENNLGVPYQEFLNKWRSYYKSMASGLKDQYTLPQDSLMIKKRNTRNLHYQSIDLNEDGTLIAYSQNNKGRYKIKIYNTLTKKTETIYSKGYRRLDQPVDYNIPVISWQSNDALSVFDINKDKVYLRTFDFKTKKKYKRPFSDIDQVLSFNYSTDGRQLVMSAVKNGQSDIFMYNQSAGVLTQLTNDLADDVTPCFISNSTSFIFSSNRITDTINKVQHVPEFVDPYNLFIFNPSTKTQLKRLTSKNDNHFPSPFDNKSFLYLSDEKGILNLYKYNLETGASMQITNYINNINNYSFSPKSSSLAFISFKSGKEHLFYQKNFNLKNLSGTRTTERKRYIKSFDKQAAVIENIDSTNFYFNSNDEININNLVFESEAKKDSIKKVNAPNALPQPLVNQLRFTGPKKYNNTFSVDKVNTTLMVDNLRGMGILLDGGMTDLLGNHKIDAGAFICFDLKSNKLYAEYKYLKSRVDFKVRYDRQALNPYNGYTLQKYVLDQFSFSFSYPLATHQRISFTPSVLHTNYSEFLTQNLNPALGSSVTAVNTGSLYESIRAEYVYDNTMVTGLNMQKGTKAKISVENYINNGSSSKNFALFQVDIRNYLPIYRGLTFATRASYGHFYGNSPKNFLIGGMDNWLFSNRDFLDTVSNNSHNPLTLKDGQDNSDLLFLKYATSIRGFKYNAQFGSSYLLFNAELRLPIISFLHNGTISSSFLRNLQIIGFTDIGSAYSGSNPFGTDNTQSTTTSSRSPFSATVTTYSSPFLVGYGGGVRSMILGYYVKADVGWGLQNGILNKPQLYVTLGHDF